MSIKNAPTPFQILKKGVVGTAMKKVKDKVIDKTSTGIANVFMGGNKAKKQIKSANAYAKTLKAVNAIKGMPDSGYESVNGKPDEAFRLRATNASNQADYEMQYAKKMNPKYPTR